MPCSFIHLLPRFCIFVAIFKDVSGDQWDPLPAGVRSVVSSNHLSESTPPRVFAEYHALLPYFRGDYGVKSELIDAASEEPVYKGAETDILPLYIPRGAIPLSINQRRVRSGNDPGIANMRVLKGPSPSIRDSPIALSVNRSVRRVITPIRRPPSGARPTPPAAYLSPWIRRRNGAATSAAEEDDVEEARKTKQKLLSQIANFKKRMDIPDDSEVPTREAPVPLDKGELILENNQKLNKETKESLNKKINVDDAPNNSTLISSTLPILAIPHTRVYNSSNLDEIHANLTVFIKSNSTEKIFKNVSKYDENLTDSSTRSSLTGTTSSPIFDISEKAGTSRANKTINTSTENPFKFGKKTDTRTLYNETTVFKAPSLNRRRPVVMETKLEAEGRRIVPIINVPEFNPAGNNDFDLLKTSVASSTTTTTTTTTATTTTSSTTTTTAQPPILSTTTFSSLRIRNSTPESRSVSKTQDLLMRRRVSIMKGLTLNKQVSNISDSSQTIIDRVLNIAANHNENDELRSNTPIINSSSVDIKIGNPIIKPALVPVDGFKVLNYNINHTLNTNAKGIIFRESRLPINAPQVSSNASISNTTPRVKIPLRNRRPIVSNPIKSSTPSIGLFTTTTSPPTSSTLSSTTSSSYITNKKPNRGFLPSQRYSSNGEEKIQSSSQFSTNLITTSTPKLPFNFNAHSSPPPSRRFNFSPSYKLPFPIREDGNKESPGFIPMLNMPKLKSPQDIVLEKLSELMKNATKGNSRSSIDIIVGEIERLNRELSSMGIHIIDAEFGGQKIKLKDQISANRSGINLPKATTITYFIPNTNNRSLIRNFEPHIVNHPQTIQDTPKDPQTENETTTLAEIEREYPRRSTSQPDRPTFTIRRYKTTLKPLSPTSYISLFNEKTKVNISSYNADDNGQVTTIYTIAKNFENDNILSTTSTQAPRDATRTRSTEVVVDANETHNTIESSYEEANNTNDTSIRNQGPTPTSNTTKDKSYVNPTAHRRPTVPKESISKTSDKQPNSTKINSEPAPEIIEIEQQTNMVDSVKNQFPILVSEYDTVLSKQDEEFSEDADSYIYLIGILGIVPCLAALVFLYRQRQKRERKSLPEREEEVEGFTPPASHIRPVGHNDTLDAFPGYIFESAVKRDSPWELSRSKLKLTSIIGEGNFGIVWKAEARNLCDWDEGGGPTVLVAVKGVKEGAGAKEKSDLLRELSIMQHLGQHANIVTLLGCCTTHEPYHLVMEYVMFGKLLTFLREQRSKNNCFNFSSDSGHLTSRDLTKFACQIATGCEYLQTRGVIHRDLAARNILLDHNKTCKIADFGLARSVKDMDSDIYEPKSKGPLPIRWMAPESLFMNIFTHKSDVWSFGILCWEIVTLGSTPYPGISAREVMRRVREGYRLERPEHCRTEFYRIVTKCWHQDHTKRVSFNTVKDDLRDLLDNYSGWIDLENFQDSTYYSMHQNNEEKL